MSSVSPLNVVFLDAQPFELPDIVTSTPKGDRNKFYN